MRNTDSCIALPFFNKILFIVEFIMIMIMIMIFIIIIFINYNQLIFEIHIIGQTFIGCAIYKTTDRMKH